MPKIMQIAEGILKTWSFKWSGLAWFCKWMLELLILSLDSSTGVMKLTDVFRTIQWLRFLFQSRLI